MIAVAPHPRQSRCALLLVLLFLATCGDRGLASPARLLAGRAGRTYAFVQQQTVSGDSGVGTVHIEFSLDDSSSSTTDISIYTEGMQHAIVQTLLSSAVVGGGSGRSSIRAPLHASPTAECTGENPLCDCTLYWRSADQGPVLPLAQVEPATIFWRDAMAVSGFYTNFSAASVAACAQAEKGRGKKGSSAIPVGAILSVDAQGEWAWREAVEGDTAPLLREVRLDLSTPHSSDPLTEAALAFRAAAEDRISATAAESSRFGAVPLGAAIAVCVVLVLVLACLLLVLYVCDDRARQAEIRGYQELCTCVTDDDDDDEEA